MAGNNSITALATHKTIPCPDCGKDIRLVIHHQAMTVACSYCLSYLVYNEKGDLLKSDRFKKKISDPVIPLHSKGVVHNNLYEVVGYMEKREKRSEYRWREYLLFNPSLGYATLSEFNGHWNFIYQLNAYPREVRKQDREVVYNDQTFDLYNVYYSVLEYAEGEFYYHILREGDTRVSEYISPPFMLIQEEGDDEIGWFMGEYISPGDVKSAFNLSEVPKRSGVGATQLMKTGLTFSTLLTVTLVYAMLLLFTQFYFSMTCKEEKILNKVYYKEEMNNEKAIVSSPFTLTGNKSALQFDISSPLSNNWLDVDIEMINDVTGERFEAVKSLEFYSGYDDGPWSEGSQNDYVVMSSVPEGTYHLNIYPEWGAQSGNNWNNPSFTLTVTRDVALMSNFLWVLLVISILPAIQYYREKSFESRRWMESDYSS